MVGVGPLDLRFSPAVLLLRVVLLVVVLGGGLGACLVDVAGAGRAVAERHHLVACCSVSSGGCR